MSGLRICMVTTFYPPFAFGGDGIAVQDLARALVRREHDVTVVHDVDAYLALQRGPTRTISPRQEADDAGAHVIRLRSGAGMLSPLLVQQLGRPVLQARRLRRLLCDPGWDVVHFHNVSLIGGPGILRYPAGAVTLYSAHEHWLVCPTHVLWRYDQQRCDERRCLRCVLAHRRPPQLWRHTSAIEKGLAGIDAMLAMSEFSRDKHREFGLRRAMEVLPPFFPDDLAPMAPGEASPHPRPYFLFAGRLEPMKGLDDLLAAFADFRKADLVVAGEGSAGARWRMVAAPLPHVTFLGQVPREDLRRWYRHAIAAVVPSSGYETFGLGLIEAMREATPVIARRVGPFPETIAASGAGVLFDTREDLIGCLGRMHEDAAYRAGFTRAAAGARQRWSEAAVMPRYLEIVRRAAERRGHVRVQRLIGESAT